jgi:hypothetical protein
MFYLFALVSMIASSATPAAIPSVPTVGSARNCGMNDPEVTLEVYRPDDDATTLRLGSFICPTPPTPLCGDADILIVLDRSGTMRKLFNRRRGKAKN